MWRCPNLRPPTAKRIEINWGRTRSTEERRKEKKKEERNEVRNKKRSKERKIERKKERKKERKSKKVFWAMMPRMSWEEYFRLLGKDPIWSKSTKNMKPINQPRFFFDNFFFFSKSKGTFLRDVLNCWFSKSPDSPNLWTNLNQRMSETQTQGRWTRGVWGVHGLPWCRTVNGHEI